MDIHFQPDYSPDSMEQMQLTTVAKLPGFSVLMRVMRAAADAFMVEALRCDTANKEVCQDRLQRAQVALKMFEMFATAVEGYVVDYISSEAARPKDQPEVMNDPTEGALDIGDIADQLEGIENLFE